MKVMDVNRRKEKAMAVPDGASIVSRSEGRQALFE